MDGDRGVSTLADPDQWARCRHENTTLLDAGGVQLTWDDDSPPGTAAGEPAGLAFDRWGRAYRAHPRAGRVSVHAEGRAAKEPGGGAFSCPTGLAIDIAQRLYVAESGGGQVAVADLWSRRLLRRIPVRTRAHPSRQPIDVAARCCQAYVLLARPAGLVLVEGRRGPLPGPQPHQPRCHGELAPRRLAVAPDGTILLLWCGPAAAVVATADGTVQVEVPGATDLDLALDGMLVVAREPGRPFRRFRPQGGGWLELEPVAATGYDGATIAIAPDAAVAFTTATGIGHTGGPAAQHRSSGRVLSYRLDSGAYRTRWGRLFADACIPPGADVRVRFLTSDEDIVADPLPEHGPERISYPIRSPELTPPLPSQLALAAAGPARPLLRRPTGRETPWTQIPAGDRYETYEAPVTAAGRYLWVILELSGTATAPPRVRALRIERPGHRLLNHLPRSWSRDEAAADFLQRFLAPAEGMLHELDGRAAQRDLLVDPAGTPQEALGWLAGFAGLVFDRRWPEPARRILVAEAYQLFRRRGTRAALTRIVEIYLGYPPVIIEQWQLRGIPGGLLGAQPGARAAPVVGRNLRAGGRLGEITVGGPRRGQDGFATAAHRFSVLIPADLSAEQLDVVRSILDTHRPAHTSYEVCELGFGMRVGRLLHLNLTSVVGPGAGWGPAILGQVAVGGDGIIGTPAVGSRLGESTVTGAVRVG